MNIIVRSVPFSPSSPFSPIVSFCLLFYPISTAMSVDVVMWKFNFNLTMNKLIKFVERQALFHLNRVWLAFALMKINITKNFLFEHFARSSYITVVKLICSLLFDGGMVGAKCTSINEFSNCCCFYYRTPPFHPFHQYFSHLIYPTNKVTIDWDTLNTIVATHPTTSVQMTGEKGCCT